MRWNNPVALPLPSVGDVRCLTKFAWLPVNMLDGTTVWLGFYKEWQQYTETVYDEESADIDWSWRVTKRCPVA